MVPTNLVPFGFRLWSSINVGKVTKEGFEVTNRHNFAFIGPNFLGILETLLKTKIQV